ncbi:MAG TPA: PrsW family intramembrane metalloprotease [Rhodoglobus sp.]|nr:PrsW family intramembrane metalloprotease [Rhodoglobus sp.]
MSDPNPTAGITDLTASARVTNAPQPAAAPHEVAATAATSTAPAVRPARGSGGLVLGIVGIVILGVLGLGVTGYLLLGLGVAAVAIGGIMALIPLAIVFLGARWVDRWEPEPRLAILFAFLWGAVMSVIIALVVGSAVDPVIAAAARGDEFVYEFIGAAIQAPVVEETAKGLGVLILFWAARRHFDGPVDGVVYAAWVAGGFAFTENILYFGSQLLDGSGVFQIFLIRGLMSPFAHVMFTAATGLALGYAARRTGALGAVGFFILGLIPAIFLHALWNGSLFFVTDFFGYYAVVQFPLFVGAVLLVVWLRRQETKLTYDRLSEYASAGWFHPDEVAALATPNGRRQAKAWASRSGRAKEMRDYIRDATRLAFARQRIVTGRDRIGAQADEAALLDAIVASRGRLTGSAVA